MHLALIYFLLFALNGCSAIQSAQPLIQKVTAIDQDGTKQILWLDERANKPEKLTQLMILDDLGQYQTEYRWREGVLHEIERKSELLLLDEQVKKQSVLIRYDENGQAIYQKYLVDGEVLPLKEMQLATYYEEAELLYDTAKSLLKRKKYFFQGYVQNGKFVACGNDGEKLLSVSRSLKKNLNSMGEKQFIAAVGVVGITRNTVETVIQLKDAESFCFTRPVFKTDTISKS